MRTLPGQETGARQQENGVCSGSGNSFLPTSIFATLLSGKSWLVVTTLAGFDIRSSG